MQPNRRNSSSSKVSIQILHCRSTLTFSLLLRRFKNLKESQIHTATTKKFSFLLKACHIVFFLGCCISPLYSKELLRAAGEVRAAGSSGSKAWAFWEAPAVPSLLWCVESHDAMDGAECGKQESVVLACCLNACWRESLGGKEAVKHAGKGKKADHHNGDIVPSRSREIIPPASAFLFITAGLRKILH